MSKWMSDEEIAELKKERPLTGNDFIDAHQLGFDAGCMTATFIPSPEFRKTLDELSAPKDEYVVESLIIIEATVKSGETMRYPTAVRERIVRCRDCRRSFEERGELWCRGIVGPQVEPDGFCAWGERKGREQE